MLKDNLMYQLRSTKNSAMSKAHLETPASKTLNNTFATPNDTVELDDRQLLLDRMDMMKAQLIEAHKREETLKGVNQTLKDVIAKMQTQHKQQQEHSAGSSCYRDFSYQIQPGEASVTFGEMTEYYEKKIEELRDEFQREKEKLEQQYIDKVEQIRHELEVEAEENLKRQLQLMQDQIRVHFQKEKVKAEHYLKEVITGNRGPQSGISLFIPSPHNASKQFRTQPQLNLTCQSTQPMSFASTTRSGAKELPRDANISLPIEAKRIDTVPSNLHCSAITDFIPNPIIQHAKTPSHTTTPLYPISYKNSQVIDLNNSVYQNCQTNSSSGSPKRKLLTEQSSDDIDFELLQGLLRKKDQIEFKIETLKYSKNPDHRQERDKLQIDLDQLVLIIQKKRRFKDVPRSRKPLKERLTDKNKSYCESVSSSIGKASRTEDLSRIYLQDKPQKLSSSKQNQNINRSVTSNFNKKGFSMTSTPTSRRFLKRFL